MILKSGLTYKGKITKVNDSYVYLLADGMENAQGIPVTAISKSVLDDGTLIVENGVVIKNIQDNQLIVPEIKVSTLTEELDFDERDWYMNGVIQAKADFKRKGFVNGCGCGFLFGVPGWIVGAYVNSLALPDVPYELMKVLDGDCRWEFEKGYKTEAKKSRNSNFHAGAGIMMGIFVLSWLSALDDLNF